MLNRDSSSNASNALNSFRKRKRTQGALLRYGAIGLIVLGLIFLVIWRASGPNAPLMTLFATETPTATLTSTPTATRTPTATATVTNTPTITLTATPSEPFPYTVVEGDSLAVIVEKYNLGKDGIKLILFLNPFNPTTHGGIDPTTQIVYPGLVIQLPNPGMPLPTSTSIPPDLKSGTEVQYVIELNDTLAGIAAKFNSTEDAIIKANKLENANVLYAGQLLKVPVNLVTATPTLPPTSTPVTPTVPGQPTNPPPPSVVPMTNAPTTASGSCRYAENGEHAVQLLSLINAERAAANAPALTVDQKLVAAARTHAVDMLCNNYFSHTGLNGSTPQTRVRMQGYAPTNVFEQIFARYPSSSSDPTTAFHWWMKDSSSRAEILNASISNIGVVYIASDDSIFGGYFVVVLANP
ncbi:MAG: hypothetical protein HKUEN02_05120 [Anaerolineaceae bacterium]|nr:MAG: hypothetical protein HKUEN02_05120 [Anaerolineaceae bacterium]